MHLDAELPQNCKKKALNMGLQCKITVCLMKPKIFLENMNVSPFLLKECLSTQRVALKLYGKSVENTVVIWNYCVVVCENFYQMSTGTECVTYWIEGVLFDAVQCCLRTVRKQCWKCGCIVKLLCASGSRTLL